MMTETSSETVESGTAGTPEPEKPQLEKPARVKRAGFRFPRESLGVFEIAGHAIAWLGVILIVYGMVSTLTAEVWLPLERFILPIAATVVLVAIGLNAAVIYALPQNLPPPSPVSRYVTAPAVILLCVGGLFFVWHQGLPVAVILGFAVLGLAWSLLRTLPRRPAAW